MEWFLASRYLLGKRKYGFISIITYITVIGVFLGTMVLVIALSIANGFEKEVRDMITGTLAHARISKYHAEPIDNGDSLQQVVRSMPGVLGAAPYIMSKAGIEYDQTQEGVMLIGIDPVLEPTVTTVHKAIKMGSFFLDSVQSKSGAYCPSVIIGSGLADRIGARPGAEVILISLISTGQGGDPVPKMMRFVVSGIFETGFFEYDATLVYLSIPSAQALLNVQGIGGFQIKTTDMFKAAEIAESIKDTLGGYPFRAEDWLSQNKTLFQWMLLEKLVIFIVISLIFIVASFNTFSSLIMMIMEKRKEIGILMSMGATGKSIRRIFIRCGLFIGISGSTGGTLLGVLVCFIQYRFHIIPLPGDVYFLKSVPVMLNFFDVCAVFVTANIVCFLASWYPSVLASKVLPAESIRYE